MYYGMVTKIYEQSGKKYTRIRHKKINLKELTDSIYVTCSWLTATPLDNETLATCSRFQCLPSRMMKDNVELCPSKNILRTISIKPEDGGTHLFIDSVDLNSCMQWLKLTIEGLEEGIIEDTATSIGRKRKATAGKQPVKKSKVDPKEVDPKEGNKHVNTPPLFLID